MPFGNNVIAVGLIGDTFATILAGVYVPKLDLPGNWTYAVAGALPLGWSRGEAAVGPLGRTDEAAGLGDISITPLLFGWHNDALNTFYSAGLTVTAPTGVWEQGSLAFIGLNYWTFTPTIAVTRLVPEHGLDLSANFGVDINTVNEDTDYYSGAMAHLDLSVTKNVTKNWGSAPSRVSSTRSGTTTAPSPMPATASKAAPSRSGHSSAYKAEFGEGKEVDFSLKWAHELEVENRMKGNGVFFEATGKF